jgi:hypothetical protein
MIRIYSFVKRETVRLKYQGEGIFEYTKWMIEKDGKPVCALTLNEMIELRDSLIRDLPQGLFLSDFVQ